MKQSDKEKLEWLASFYKEAADTGREIQFLEGGVWRRNECGPHVGSMPPNWRLKPVPQKAFLVWIEGAQWPGVFGTREQAEHYCQLNPAPTQIQEVERTATESP